MFVDGILAVVLVIKGPNTEAVSSLQYQQRSTVIWG